MPVGIVKWFSGIRGYGFIAPDDGSADVFVSVEQANRANLTPTAGSRVAYDLTRRNGKPAAENLLAVEGAEQPRGERG